MEVKWARYDGTSEQTMAAKRGTASFMDDSEDGEFDIDVDIDREDSEDGEFDIDVDIDREDSEDDEFDVDLSPQQPVVMKPKPTGDIKVLLEDAQRGIEVIILKKIKYESEKAELQTRVQVLKFAKDNGHGSLQEAVKLQETQQLRKQKLLDELFAAGIQDPANLNALKLTRSRSSVLRAGEELKKLERDIEVQPCLTKLAENAESGTKDYQVVFDKLQGSILRLNAIDDMSVRINRWIKILRHQMQLKKIGSDGVTLYPQPIENPSDPPPGFPRAIRVTLSNLCKGIFTKCLCSCFLRLHLSSILSCSTLSIS